MIRTPGFHGHGLGTITSQDTEIPEAVMWPKIINKKSQISLHIQLLKIYHMNECLY